jgi:hypothetical protein
MRRFFRPADLATLVAVCLIAAPSVNRLAAQDSQPTNSELVVVAQDSAMARESVVAPTMDLRALTTAPVAVSRVAATSRGASMDGLRSAVHARESMAPLSVNAQKANLGQSQALMVVGGAALIVGAIIGDDPGTIIMVGGAIVGLYGLYQYLQ